MKHRTQTVDYARIHEMRRADSLVSQVKGLVGSHDGYLAAQAMIADAL